MNLNATEAARRAGYKGNNATLRAVVSENLTKPNIRKEIDSRMAKALSRTNVTIDKVLLELEVLRIKATSENRFSAAIRCLELQGRYLRMWTDKMEQPPTIDEVSTDELVRYWKMANLVTGEMS